jgi:hypothetical protein
MKLLPLNQKRALQRLFAASATLDFKRTGVEPARVVKGILA